MPSGRFCHFFRRIRAHRLEYSMWQLHNRRAFWDTSAGQQILTLDLIFRKISDAQRIFVGRAAQRGVELSCPPDCGACCHGFMPDVLPVEADYIAFFLLINQNNPGDGPEGHFSLLSPSTPASPSPCPFYAADRPGANCRIYEARPLICRLFGFSGTKTKKGGTAYRLCRHMPTPRGFPGRSPTQEALQRAIGTLPPLMSDFSIGILAIDPSRASERKPLVEALPPALARISATLHYCPEEPNAA